MSNIENADLLTNAAAALEEYREEERMLETEINIMQARLEAVRGFVAALSGKRRRTRGRPPAPKLVETDAPATAEPELVA